MATARPTWNTLPNDSARRWTLHPIQHSELRHAIAGLLVETPDTPGVLEREIHAFDLYARATPLVRTAHWGAFRGSRLLATCLCFDYPGRTGLIFMPERNAPSELDCVILDLLTRQTREAASRGIRILQVILKPDLPHTESLLQAAGFVFLSELCYLERAVRPPDPAPTPQLAWQTYTPRTHDRFLETIARTYTGSLDCPLLAGTREIHDVLEGHKASGFFNPGYWFLAMDRDSPLAVLLLSSNPNQRNTEIVYMGVVPEARGNGLGRALLHAANLHAHRVHAECLTLAVDAANHFAVRLYRQDGFTDRTRRRAWVHVVAGPDPSAESSRQGVHNSPADR